MAATVEESTPPDMATAMVLELGISQSNKLGQGSPLICAFIVSEAWMSDADRVTSDSSK
jgi:hypothetical protein